MGSATITRAFNLGGIGFSEDPDEMVVTFQHTNIFEIDLPVGFPVSAWVKTDADTAAGNFTAGHGQTTGTYDVYWTESSVKKVRYGVTVTITTNALALDGGSGDDFPATATAGIVATKQVSTPTAIDGDDIQIIGIFFQNTSDPDARAHWDMQDSGPATIEQGTSHANGVSKMQHMYSVAALVADGQSNVFTGNVIATTKASNSSTTAAGKLYILVGEDAA